LLEHGDIEMGHARALLALQGDAQNQAAQIVSGKGMTVRDTENLVRRLLEPTMEKEPTKKDPDVQRLQTELSENLGAPVNIDHNAKGKGKVVINFSSLDQLDGILGHIK
jgi:ParB family chromosome partitioning protein